MKRKPSVGRMATTAKPLCLGTAWHVEFTIIDDTRRSRFRRKCRFSEDGPPRVLKTADADGAASLTPTSDQLPRSLMIRKRTATYWTSGCRFTISPTNASSISSRFFKRSSMNSSQRPWTAALDLRKDARQVQVPEYACHEGNYAMFNILSGARAAERKGNGKVLPTHRRRSSEARV